MDLHAATCEPPKMRIQACFCLVRAKSWHYG